VQHVADVNDLDALDAAINKAKAVTDQPSLIICRTHIGYGSPNKVDSEKAHGEALGVKEIELTKQNLGWPSLEPFFVPQESLEHWRTAGRRGAPVREAWEKTRAAYSSAFPDLGAEYNRRLAGKRRDGWDKNFPVFTKENGNVATRASSSAVLNAFDAQVPELFGGAADLNPSTLTYLKDSPNFDPTNYGGRNIHFGVREHAMGAIMNGIALHGSFIPFGSTFFIFSDYMRPAIRLAGLGKLHTIYVWTHDSVMLGEDGPTHQPIEQLGALRLILNLDIFRPADAVECAAAWAHAVSRKDGPTGLVLTRQKIPPLPRAANFDPEEVLRGGYVVSRPAGPPDLLMMGTGSEVHVLAQAAELLAKEGRRVQVVSIPCLELFERQTRTYQESVLPPGTVRISLEAGRTEPWRRWVGEDGLALGIDRYGASAPDTVLAERLGLTPSSVADRVRRHWASHR